MKYRKMKCGDILEVVNAGAPGYAKLGELVRVVAVRANSATVENCNGDPCDFLYNAGTDRLKPTKWKGNFPEQAAKDQA